jgi:hypothetical protein
MPNNPVQIVLNHDAFLRAPEPGRSGPEKDFFDGDDARFRAHKLRLLAALDEIDRTLATSPMGPLSVKMRIEAIAKSYRPNRALFTADLFPCVGAGAPGELYFRLPRIHLQRLRRRVVRASTATDKRY